MKGLTEGLDQTCEVNFWPSLSLCFQRIVKGLRGSYCRSSCFAVAFAFVSLYQSVINSSSQSCACLPQRTTVYLLLALHREIATLYRDASADFSLKQEVGLHLSGNRDFAFDIACVSLSHPQLREALLVFIQTSKFLNTPAVKAFAQALVTNQLGPLQARPGASAAQCVLVDLTLHLAAVLLCEHQGVLDPLQQLALTPANMQVRAADHQLLRGYGFFILRIDLIVNIC